MIDIKLMNEMALTPGKNDKVTLLKRQPESARTFLRWALDPMVTFGVTVDVEDMLILWGSGGCRDPEGVWWEDFYGGLQKLASRELTGNAAKADIDRRMILAPSDDHIRWACRCIMKDLRSGFSISTVNKAFPGLIDDMSVMLAETYDPEDHDDGKFMGHWAVEPKLDGYRMTIIDGVPYSRNWRVYETVDHILAQFTKEELSKWVIDGEIMGESKDFDEAGGSIRRKNKQAGGAVFHAFDCVTREQWGIDGASGVFHDRRGDLEHLCFGKKHIQLVKSVVLLNPTHEELIATMRQHITEGYEGAMLKNMSSPYVYDRSAALLKLKDFVSADLRVVGYTEGRGKHKNRLGALEVDLNSVVTKVGSGFKDHERDVIWNDRNATVGRIIEVQYQNLTKDGRLRFPVFLRFRPDRE